MKIKTIIVLLMLSVASIMFTGCVDDEPVVIEPLHEDVINETPKEVEEIPIEEPEVIEEETPVVDPKTYTVRLEYFLSKPSLLEINKSDTVVWWNFQQSPQRMFTLASDDELWENTNLIYRRTFTYTFNKSGTYNYSILGNPRMDGSIIVK